MLWRWELVASPPTLQELQNSKGHKRDRKRSPQRMQALLERVHSDLTAIYHRMLADKVAGNFLTKIKRVIGEIERMERA